MASLIRSPDPCESCEVTVGLAGLRLSRFRLPFLYSQPSKAKCRLEGQPVFSLWEMAVGTPHPSSLLRFKEGPTHVWLLSQSAL